MPSASPFFSSIAAINAGRALGAILNSGLDRYATFDGQSVDENSIIVGFTIVGDLNLDKTVSISDFIDLSANFNQAGGWRQGDGNYDRNVTISDFIDLASNFGQSLIASPPMISPQPAASKQLPLVPASEGAAVDEPDVLVLKQRDRRLDFAPSSRHHQLHHLRQQHKTLKWRSRAGAY